MDDLKSGSALGALQLKVLLSDIHEYFDILTSSTKQLHD